MTYGPIPSLLSSMTCRGHLLSSPNHSKERIAFHRSPPPCIFLSPSSLSPLSLLPHQNQLPARIQPCRAAAPRAALQAQQRRPPAPRRPPARAPEARRDDARADPRRATEAAATGAPSAARPAPSPTASPVVRLFPAISGNHCDRFFFSVISPSLWKLTQWWPLKTTLLPLADLSSPLPLSIKGNSRASPFLPTRICLSL
jgi:hypothetical protein